ncbi:hypothetical protein K1T71_012973 [Dendrolimus kikuchii]|uniref:Uncharacterized protein n=1 Tax=Dendrolimus kikuchii TaxID=765133 RepID=A0ACC1CIK6_9NEOP|nr:hypothetical protein K1T71_012973 [Dendrolimus kikuchii]
MAASTPRRSARLPHNHTPKMSERKKGLFQCESEPPRESLTKHRRLPVVDSESDSEDCDLGIISTLDSSSGEENDSNVPKTPERFMWREKRNLTHKLFKETHDLKNFIKSPFTLKKYQTHYSCPEKCTGSVSTPATPHLQHHPGTPSSTHSCGSVHTTSSTSSKARKSLTSLIVDTESCSSSLKDLNFDTDSGTDSKENTPTKVLRRSSRKQKMTPKFQSFKGILVEQKKNLTPAVMSPMKTAVVCLTKMDMSVMSPTRMLKTPQNTEISVSPPKIGHNRRSVIEIAESPESCDSERSYKRLRNESITEGAPNTKFPRLDVPKARLSLFNSDRLKEMLSAKSFYGKSNPDLNTSISAKFSNAIEASTVHRHRSFSHRYLQRRKRRPGQINLGVKHRIRKPKHHKNKVIKSKENTSSINNTTVSNMNISDASMLCQNISQELGHDKTDPFSTEKQTIEALLSQWEEEEVPESELTFLKSREELPCFNSTVIEETNQIFQPITAVPVNADVPHDREAVLIELGTKNDAATLPGSVTTLPVIVTVMPDNMTAMSQSVVTVLQSMTILSQNVALSQSMTIPQTSAVQNATEMLPITTELPEAGNLANISQDVVMEESEGHVADHGNVPKSGQYLPVEGGYILVDENPEQVQEVVPDLDEIERELKMLDEQILKMSESNNIDPQAVLASLNNESVEPSFPISTHGATPVSSAPGTPKTERRSKLFSIFSKPNPGVNTPSPKEKIGKKSLLKSVGDQYVIDAGQKKFGATQCPECGTIYQIGDPQDEHDHLVHHNATDVLRFNGWKEEYIVGKFDNARCIRVRGGENGWKRVDTLLQRVVHPQLGYEGVLPRDKLHSYTAYLYIENKKIIGCLILEPKLKGYKLIPGDPECCSVECYPVKCGVSRLWTHINHRRQGVAARLLDCARASFLYGQALVVSEIAFSAPTASGKAFATKYCGTPNFYVYLD